MLVAGVSAFAVAYALFGVGPTSVITLGVAFVLAGAGIGCVETAEHASVAHLAAENVRGSAFGVLAATQSLGNFVASTVAGVLWSAGSPRAAFVFLTVMMVVAVALIIGSSRGVAGNPVP